MQAVACSLVCMEGPHSVNTTLLFFRGIELSAFLYSPEVPPLSTLSSFHVSNFVNSFAFECMRSTVLLVTFL